MKYIRTKNKVLETNGLLIERFSNEFVKITYEQIGLPNQHIEEIEVVKEANTIEELCDEFVIKAYIDSYPQIYHSVDLKELNKFRNKDTIVCGAIWTDKGLIYVAKMNKKGELELL